MKTHIFIFMGLIAVTLACNKPADTTEEKAITHPQTASEIDPEAVTGATEYTGDNSQTSLDWSGTYFATLPCASCEGIETWVTLNQDGTFILKTHHMGLNDDREEIYTGKFTWEKTGSIVTLQGLIGGAPGKYKVGENQIWHLDQDGNQIKGELADFYILKKQ